MFVVDVCALVSGEEVGGDLVGFGFAFWGVLLGEEVYVEGADGWVVGSLAV